MATTATINSELRVDHTYSDLGIEVVNAKTALTEVKAVDPKP